MRKIFKLIVPVFAGAALFSSCSSEEDKTENLKHSTDYNMLSSIDHLAVVGSIDLLQIIEKSGFESNPNLPSEAGAMYKMMVKEKLDADKTGIDLSGNNHFAVSIVDPEKPDFVVYCAKVTNADNAKHTVQDLLKGTYTKEEIDGTEYQFVVDDEVAVAWDDKDIVLVFSDQEKPKEIAKDLLLARFVDGPDADKGMEDYLKQHDDMNIYVQVGNSKDFLKAQNADFPEEMLNSLEDAYYVGSGNFNNGEIVFDWNIHAEGIKNSEYNALAADAINESFYNYLTAENLIAFGTASINMEAIFNALEFAQNKDFSFDKFEDQTGLSKQMMQEMFTGEFALSFVDIQMVEMGTNTADMQVSKDDFFEESYSYNEEVPVIIFTAGIGDSTKFGELLRLSGEAKTMNGVYQMDKDAFITFHKDKLILTTDQATAAYFASGQSYPKYSIPGGVNGKPLFGFANTNPMKMPAGLMKMAENEEGEIAVSFMGLFESVVFEGEFEHMEFRASMNNKSENALKVITDFVISMIKEKQMI
ncbi:MAG: hypothetical protein H6599_08440 [Flavobacteriales bacterium]|nr:hypothetical protein [Flavobacteriales bacterium]